VIVSVAIVEQRWKLLGLVLTRHLVEAAELATYIRRFEAFADALHMQGRSQRACNLADPATPYDDRCGAEQRERTTSNFGGVFLFFFFVAGN
jgi:hypothetical protein